MAASVNINRRSLSVLVLAQRNNHKFTIQNKNKNDKLTVIAIANIDDNFIE